VATVDLYGAVSWVARWSSGRGVGLATRRSRVRFPAAAASTGIGEKFPKNYQLKKMTNLYSKVTLGAQTFVKCDI